MDPIQAAAKVPIGPECAAVLVPWEDDDAVDHNWLIDMVQPYSVGSSDSNFVIIPQIMTKDENQLRASLRKNRDKYDSDLERAFHYIVRDGRMGPTPSWL